MPSEVEYNSQKYAHSLFLSELLENSLFRALQKYLEVQPGENVLEVGCNRGAIVKRMQEVGARAHGVDINTEAIQEGTTRNLHVMDATNLAFPNETFDKLYSLHTIEHILETEKAFAEMERVTKPGGKIVLTYPIEPGFLRGFSCIHHAIALYKNPLFARRLHIHSFNPGKVKKLIEGSNLIYIHTSLFDIPLYPHQYLSVLQKVQKK